MIMMMIKKQQIDAAIITKNKMLISDDFERIEKER
jgi:hypothetical protein